MRTREKASDLGMDRKNVGTSEACRLAGGKDRRKSFSATASVWDCGLRGSRRLGRSPKADPSLAKTRQPGSLRVIEGPLENARPRFKNGTLGTRALRRQTQDGMAMKAAST